jgi:hypothetical protein
MSNLDELKQEITNKLNRYIKENDSILSATNNTRIAKSILSRLNDIDSENEIWTSVLSELKDISSSKSQFACDVFSYVFYCESSSMSFQSKLLDVFIKILNNEIKRSNIRKGSELNKIEKTKIKKTNIGVSGYGSSMKITIGKSLDEIIKNMRTAVDVLYPKAAVDVLYPKQVEMQCLENKSLKIPRMTA